MTTTFDHPPHPSQLQATHDPHKLPDFHNPKPFTKPVLYLPPLLSSLPPNVRHDIPAQIDNPPLVTDTHLPDIDPASLSLHKALHHFRPLNNNYADTPYHEAFNWSELTLPESEEREWYCVVFRSKRKPASNGLSLYEADKLAHEEAVQNGGLILYWYGIPNPETGLNLATCIWQSRKHASAANSRPHHIKAMKLAAGAYEIYNLERHVLKKAAGEKGVTIESYQGGDVGW